MDITHLMHDLHHRQSILVIQQNEVEQHLSENEDTILLIHNSLTSSSETVIKASLRGLLARLHAR